MPAVRLVGGGLLRPKRLASRRCPGKILLGIAFKCIPVLASFKIIGAAPIGRRNWGASRCYGTAADRVKNGLIVHVKCSFDLCTRTRVLRVIEQYEKYAVLSLI